MEKDTMWIMQVRNSNTYRQHERTMCLTPPLSFHLAEMFSTYQDQHQEVFINGFLEVI